ncbi:MAG: hypothetical protein ACE5DU_03095, partial [Nitrosopumilus sp.]
MSENTNNDSFRTEMITEIKKIQEELNELKNIKQNIVKKSTKRKNTAKKKVVKRKPARKTATKKKVVKRKPARKTATKK